MRLGADVQNGNPWGARGGRCFGVTGRRFRPKLTVALKGPPPMTVTLDLPPHTEQAYRAEAAARGVAVEVVVREVLLAHEPGLGDAEISPREWVEKFRAWARGHAGENLPVLSDEAVSREFIYGDRGL
jgi:hypothetical protein